MHHRLFAAVATSLLVFAIPTIQWSHADEKSVSFNNDVLPVLTKFGCNGGGCHGKATGQNGFKLSLFGYDAAFDYGALVHEAFGRRIWIGAPDASLILLKATLQTPHGGGQRFDMDSDAYRLLRTWIAQGAPRGPANDPMLTGLTITPAADEAFAYDGKQQLRVAAEYSDGSRRDVTHLAEYSTAQAALLRVSSEGMVEALGRPGEGNVMVRYLELVGSARFVLPYARRGDDAAYSVFRPKNYIDELVLKKWRGLGLLPSTETEDSEFIRRIYLDLLGALPTPQEVRDFLADSAADKRDALVDRLFKRPEYVDLWATKWGDILRNKERNAGFHEQSVRFDAWIRRGIAENKPWDKFARELLTVRGHINDQPQIDWYRQLMNVQMRVEDTCQVFLGMRVSCANCHNHPFQRISQDDYWQFAAFFARFDAKPNSNVYLKEVRVNPKGKLTHPRTGQPLVARAFGTPEYEFGPDEDPREKLLDWMTSPKNTYFKQAIANRIWAHFMGRGLVESIDDIRPTNPPTNPELLDALADDVAQHGFDLQHLMKAILKSRVYGLSTLPRPENAADGENYARHYPQRLSAQVLFDAVTSVTGVPEPFKSYPNVRRASELPNDAAISDFLDIFGRSIRDSACECEASREPSFPQVLYLMYSSQLQDRLSNKEGNASRLATSKQPTRAVVDELYLLAYARHPTDEESAAATKLIDEAATRQHVVEDLMWTFLNSKEFLFNH